MKASPQDEAAIGALFAAQSEAWGRSDGEGFAAVFTEDADFINILGHAYRGRADIAKQHNQIFSTIYSDTTMRFGDLRIRLIRPDVATVEAAPVVMMKGAQRHANVLAVAVRGSDGWRLQAFHNMIPFVLPSA